MALREAFVALSLATGAPALLGCADDCALDAARAAEVAKQHHVMSAWKRGETPDKKEVAKIGRESKEAALESCSARED